MNVHSKLTFLSFFSLAACALLGTKSKLNDSVEISTIKTVGVVLSKSTFSDQEVNKITDAIFKEEVMNQLKLVTGKEIKYLGETSEFLKRSSQSTKENQVDAIIQAEIYLGQALTLGDPKRYNSKVQTQMFTYPEKTFIAETHFGTNMGKSYWRHPLLEVAIKDGVKGAIGPLGKLFN
jgi:hypothetical protein